MSQIIRKLLATNPCNWAPAPLRLALGLVMTVHGAQKLFGAFGGHGLQATADMFANGLHLHPGILWAALAAAGEFFGGLGLFIGLATRFFGTVTTIIMAVAIITVHHGAFLSASNGMEYPLTLLLASISLVIAGGGAFSVDSLIAKKSRRETPAK